ncbi:LysR family transcriptional regulator [Youngiibacter multivorans]|uniref:DNA-binding transcriptional LysR family regulator n=1 Tax=Youngiibacter multivorans TaxID=937251 RepID=A0ABS4G6D4_9CLOT|nr:LysR family transcriptional regulator [Youngiibacter multivorans]MBP1920142.1 DNA-binding transcriptional LysR family regulator [Youngiibacter multivorans]
MDTRKLIYFEAVARNNNFTKAAEELLISQPSITLAIKNLEDELGVLLFKREQNRILLTDEGQILLVRSREIIDSIEKSKREIQEYAAGGEKILRFGVPPIMGSWILPSLINDFTLRFPGLKLEISELGSRNIIQSLNKDLIDVGYIVFDDNYSIDFYKEYEVMEITKGQIYVLLNKDHPFAGQTSIDIRTLDNQPYIAYIEGTFMQTAVYAELEKKNVSLKEVYKPNQLATLINLVSYGCGISFIMDNRVPIVKDNSNLMSIPLKEPLYYSTGLIWKKKKYLSKVARSFIDFMAERKNNQLDHHDQIQKG